MKMNELHVGQTAEICSVNAGGALEARLRTLGVAAGGEVTLLRRAPFGGGLLLACGGTHIALRASLASRIEVRPKEGQSGK